MRVYVHTAPHTLVIRVFTAESMFLEDCSAVFSVIWLGAPLR